MIAETSCPICIFSRGHVYVNIVDGPTWPTLLGQNGLGGHLTPMAAKRPVVLSDQRSLVRVRVQTLRPPESAPDTVTPLLIIDPTTAIAINITHYGSTTQVQCYIEVYTISYGHARQDCPKFGEPRKENLISVERLIRP